LLYGWRAILCGLSPVCISRINALIAYNKVNNDGQGAAMIDGLVLAGGKSQRMGMNKAHLMVGDKTLLQHQVDAMRPLVAQVFVAGNALKTCEPYNDTIQITDFFAGAEGPLSGALSALKASKAEYLWIMPCDSFGFNKTLKEQLLQALCEDGADIAYVTHNNNRHPLLAVWRSNMQQPLRMYLESGERAVLKWYDTLNTVRVEFPLQKGQCFNMNTPEEYQALLSDLC
jgi:molybdenum cofactor guanylyltransferase